MPYVYQTLTIKPPGAKWYPEVEPVKHAEYMKWFESYPGLLKVNNRRLTENEHLRVAQFADQETYEKFVKERDQREDYIERQKWLEDNGFITEVQIVQVN